MPTRKESPHDIYVAGRNALDSGDSESALRLIGAAVEAKPENTGWRIALAQVLVNVDRLEDAVSEFHKAAELAPEVAKIQILLGRALTRQSKTIEAWSAFIRGTEVEPGSVAAWVALGRYAKERGDNESSAVAYRRVIELDPENISAHAALASFASIEGNFEVELRHRREVADRNESHVPSQIVLAALLLKAGYISEARDRYSRVATIDPDHAGASAVVEELERWLTDGTPRGGVVSVDYYNAVYMKLNHYQADGADLEHASHFSMICDLLAEDGALSVLDIGCGPGQFAQYMRSRLHVPYTGVDFSPVAIRSANDRNVSDSVFMVLDVNESPLPDHDDQASIVCTEVLEHILDDRALVDKMPAGRMCYCSVPSFHTFGHVRYFESVSEVKARYGEYFTKFRVHELPIGNSGNRLYVFSGLRNDFRHSA